MILRLNNRTLKSLLPALLILGWSVSDADDTAAVEFCLTGQFDLGVRLQGMQPRVSERYPTEFCVITANDSSRVHFHAKGKSNPDMDGDWAVSFIAEDVVRIVNRESPPDIEFSGVSVVNEALSYRRMDPRRLVAELNANPGWLESEDSIGAKVAHYPGSRFEATVTVENDQLQSFQTSVDLPLRGQVPVVWYWRWPTDSTPELRLYIDGELLFEAEGRFRAVPESEAEALWQLSGKMEAIAVPGDRWPSRVSMQLEEVAAGVYMVHGVRTGFSHLVVDTEKGLVIADAPAGWIEIHQIPPTDLVPGLGVSGLSEKFIEFLAEQFPNKPIRAVAITHAHDDHAGGARAFAAAGAAIYAPADAAEFLQTTLNDWNLPEDRFSLQSRRLEVLPVDSKVILADPVNPVEITAIPTNPHVSAALGVWARDAGVFFQSDLHVPDSDQPEPRADRALTECWFAQWAVKALPAETIVLNSHSNSASPVSRLAEYLETPICQEVP